MPDIQHSALTGAELHEPKGAAGASANETYVADGLGSGNWLEPEPKGVVGSSAGFVYVSDGADSGTMEKLVTSVPLLLHTRIDNVSTADTIYIPMPYAGNVIKVTTVLEGTLVTADSTIDVKNSAGSSMGTITVAFSGSAAGDLDSLVPVSNNVVTDDDYITIETDGASVNTRSLWITVVLERT